MKKGWKYKKIKDVGEVIGGTKKITAKAVSAKSLKELPVGTVILSSRAPIGKIAINKVPMYCNQGFKCVVCGPELYNEFLYWWLYGKVDYLNSLGTGATFKEISKTVVENIVVPIPPLDEQQRIVSRLDAAFAHIDELKANTEKQLNEARALFQKALTKAMEPKEGWEEKTLSPSLQDEIQRKTTGAALKQINIKDLRNLQLFVPSLSEQQRIVSRLDSLSAHVRELEEVTQKTIAECDALKQALLRQVFE